MARPPGSAIVDPKTGQITPEWLDFLSRDFSGESGGITIIKPGPGGGSNGGGGGGSFGPVDANTLTGTTLAPNVIFSNLTSVGILTSGMLGPGFIVDFGITPPRGQLPWTALPSGTGTWSAGHVAITGIVSAQAFVGDGSGLTNVPFGAHALTHQAGGTDPIKLDALALPDDVAALNATTAVHGLLPKLSGVSTQFLNGQGQWTEPASTGGGALAPHASTHMPGGNDVLTLSSTARVLGRVSAGAGPVELLSYIDLPTTTPGPPVANVGRLHCLDVNGYELFAAKDVTGADLFLSRDTVTVVKVLGFPIARGQAVYISGASGANVEVQLARADAPGTLPAIGLALDSGAVNAFIRVMTAGKIAQIDTSLFAEGDRLFVSTTNAGGLTVTPPPYPNYMQRVGVVTRAHATQGEVLVFVSTAVRDQHAPSHETGGSDPITALAATVITSGTLNDARLSPNVLTVPGGYPGSTGVFLRGDGTWAVTSGGAGGGPHHTTHEPGGSDPITQLDASVITTGTMSDARLSANVALRNNDNVFTAVNQVNNTGWRFTETALAPDTRLWKIGPSGGTFYFSPLLETGGGLGSDVSITRDGILEASKNLRAAQDVYALNGAFYGSGIGLTNLPAQNLIQGPLPYSVVTLSAASRVLGRGDSGPGAMQEITIGFGLTMTGTTLSATGSGSGGGPHHTTHEPGGSDAILGAAWTWIANVFTAPQRFEQGIRLYRSTAPVDTRLWSLDATASGALRIHPLTDAGADKPAIYALFESSGDLVLTQNLYAFSVNLGGRVQWGVTAGEPMISRNGVGLEARLADNSALTTFRAKLDAGDLVTGTVPDARLTVNVLRTPGGYPGGTTLYLRADGTWATPPGSGVQGDEVFIGPGDPGAAYELWFDTDEPVSGIGVALHATTHSAGGTDPVTVTALAGYPGGTTNFLRADGTWASPPGGTGGGVTDALYWVSTAHSGLSAEVSLGALASGYLMITTTAGVATPSSVVTIPESDVTNLVTDLAARVVGPASALNNGIALFSGTTGKLLKDSAVLMANVALKNAANTFTVSPNTFSAVDPVLRFVDTGAPLDGKEFDIQDIGAELTFKAYDDSQIPQATPLRLLRDGSVIVGTTLTAPGGLSTTPLNATNLTSGTVPDARLSANVQMKPIAVTDLPAHASRHQPGGADAMAVDAAAATGSLRTLGTGATQAAPGNDARFTDARTPTVHAPTHKSGGSDAIKLDEFAAPTDVTTLNASTTAHGLLPKLSGTATQYLSGAGTWTTPSTVPSAHATTHQPGGSDPMAVDAIAATGSLRTLGTGAQQAAPGNDGRFTDARTPTAHATTHKSGGSDPIALDTLAAPTDILTLNASTTAHGLLRKLSNVATQFLDGTGAWSVPSSTPGAHATTHQPGGSDPMAVDAVAATGSLRTLGTGATQAAPGNDARFTDARAPTAHRTTHETGGADALTALSAAILTSGSLPFARVQLSASPRLLGRGTAAAGAMEEITLGSGLTMTATTLSVTPAAPAAHATTHKSGGSDAIKLDELAAPTDVTTLNASTTAHGLLLKLSGSASQFLSGAGTWVTPAAGDEVWIGTADPGAAYELWFDTDEPGVDPTISPHHPTHEAGGADEIVNINAARLTSGTLADARLSTNVPLKNASNVFTKNYAIGAHAISIQAQNPTMSLIETAAPADARMWRFIAYGQLFYIMSTNDAETANLGALVMDRSGGLTCGRTINMQGPTPFLALTDMNQAVDLRAFIIQNSGGTLAFTPFNDAFTSAGWTNIRLNRNGDTLVCPSQSGSRLQFGGATSGQPALRWSGAVLECVLADNSNWAGFRCATLDVYSTLTAAGSIIANSAVTVAGALTANGGISCFQTITFKDGANVSCAISQNANYLRFSTTNYGQVSYMDTAGNWTMSGAITPVGGIQFASTPASASPSCLDAFAEMNWTPAFSFSAGGTPTYSIQHGLAVKIGRFVYFGGRCAISAKGSMGSGGNTSITGLPWVSEGTYWGGGLYAGYVVGGTGTIAAGVGGYVPPGSQYVQMTINAYSGIALLQPDWMQAGFDLIFFGSYFAST